MESILSLILLGKILLPTISNDISTPFFPTTDITATDDSANTENEILWLARIMYSETKVSYEMRLIGWVVRNRVETGFRGDTYRDVAQSPGQFSGLNPHDTEYKNNVSLGYGDTKNLAWRQALVIAEEVYYAPAKARPLPLAVRHFYSPKAVFRAPSWADNKMPYHTIQSSPGLPARFAFYSDIQ